MAERLTITMDPRGTVKAVRFDGKPLRLTPRRLALLWCAVQWYRLWPEGRMTRDDEGKLVAEIEYQIGRRFGCNS